MFRLNRYCWRGKIRVQNRASRPNSRLENPIYFLLKKLFFFIFSFFAQPKKSFKPIKPTEPI